MPRAPAGTPNIAPAGRRAYRSTLTAEERSENARAAVNARWARVADTRAASRTAREAARARFYAEADAQGITDPATRERMARSAEAAHMAKMRAARLRVQRLRAALAAAETAAADGEAG